MYGGLPNWQTPLLKSFRSASYLCWVSERNCSLSCAGGTAGYVSPATLLLKLRVSQYDLVISLLWLTACALKFF